MPRYPLISMRAKIDAPTTASCFSREAELRLVGVVEELTLRGPRVQPDAADPRRLRCVAAAARPQARDEQEEQPDRSGHQSDDHRGLLGEPHRATIARRCRRCWSGSCSGGAASSARRRLLASLWCGHPAQRPILTAVVSVRDALPATMRTWSWARPALSVLRDTEPRERPSRAQVPVRRGDASGRCADSRSVANARRSTTSVTTTTRRPPMRCEPTFWSLGRNARATITVVTEGSSRSSVTSASS